MSKPNTLLKAIKSLVGATLPRLILLTAMIAAVGLGQSMQELKMTVGRSVVIDYPEDIGRISTSNPEVADYVAVSTREILLNPKGIGSSTLIVWSKTGQREFYSITVENNLEPFKKLLKTTFPNDDIQIQASRDTVTLIGRVSSQLISDRVAAMCASLGKTVVNNLKLPPSKVEKQILLRVKFAELNHSAGKAFGVSLANSGAGNAIARVTPGGIAAPTFAGTFGKNSLGNANFDMSDLMNIFAFLPGLNLGAFVRDLQSQGVLQILAEPNLVTNNGQQATFLVGGEFPVPVLQGGSNAGAVTIQFKQFGVQLTFKPEITENNTIKMYVKPEVSTIDLANGVSFGGYTIPAIGTRRVETNLELGEGQSFVIGGLIDERVTDTISKVPGLANIPLLGTIFKSRTENRSKSELIVLVTPEITTPISKGDPTPEIKFPKEFYVVPPKKEDRKSSPKASSAAAATDPKQTLAGKLFKKK